MSSVLDDRKVRHGDQGQGQHNRHHSISSINALISSLTIVLALRVVEASTGRIPVARLLYSVSAWDSICCNHGNLQVSPS
jgi:hypothetical protein